MTEIIAFLNNVDMAFVDDILVSAVFGLVLGVIADKIASVALRVVAKLAASAGAVAIVLLLAGALAFAPWVVYSVITFCCTMFGRDRVVAILDALKNLKLSKANTKSY